MHPLAPQLSAERRRVRLLANALSDTGDDQQNERARLFRKCILATGQGVLTRLEPQRLGDLPEALHENASYCHRPGPSGLPGGPTVNPQEITAFLAASHIAVVVTVNRNGHPHLTPNWYRYDGQVLTLVTRKDRLKYRNLQRDHRISVCMYDPPAASNYVVISGTATCHDQDIWDEARRILQDIWDEARRILARYRAPHQVEECSARWKTEPRVLITVTPESISTRAPRRW